MTVVCFIPHLSLPARKLIGGPDAMPRRCQWRDRAPGLGWRETENEVDDGFLFAHSTIVDGVWRNMSVPGDTIYLSPATEKLSPTTAK